MRQKYFQNNHYIFAQVTSYLPKPNLTYFVPVVYVYKRPTEREEHLLSLSMDART
jgi:hypothetical protein